MGKELFTKLSELSKRIETLKQQTQTEEATKMSFIIPFFSALGYDVFNPLEFVPEFTADVGTKKGEKVDYAVFKDGKPIILVEAKHWTENLDSHINQLFRYFAVTSAKFAILTNGIEYRFYTDLEQANIMDIQPFMVVNMLNLKENVVGQLEKFAKETFNVDEILTSAEELKYTNSITEYINRLYNEPSDDFVKFILKEVYSGKATQFAVDKFSPIVKKSFNLVVNELINDKLKTAFEGNAPKVDVTAAVVKDVTEPAVEIAAASEEVSPEKTSKIVTTDEELQAYYIVRGILAEITDIENITYKDTESYFGVIFKNNTWKWICRFKFGAKGDWIAIILPNENNKPIHNHLDKLNDIYKFKQEIINSCKRFL